MFYGATGRQFCFTVTVLRSPPPHSTRNKGRGQKWCQEGGKDAGEGQISTLQLPITRTGGGIASTGEGGPRLRPKPGARGICHPVLPQHPTPLPRRLAVTQEKGVEPVSPALGKCAAMQKRKKKPNHPKKEANNPLISPRRAAKLPLSPQYRSKTPVPIVAPAQRRPNGGYRALPGERGVNGGGVFLGFYHHRSQTGKVRQEKGYAFAGARLSAAHGAGNRSPRHSGRR